MIEAPLLHDDGARRAARSIELLRSPANPALQVASALDRVRRAPSILGAMRTLGQLTPVVDGAVHEGVDVRSLLEPILAAVHDDSDTVTALAAVHALARVPGPRADLALADLITDGHPGFEEHALWSLNGRPTTHLLVWPVARALARGSLAGMHAQEVLAGWAATDPHLVLTALEAVLAEAEGPSARRHLVETIGLVPGRIAADALVNIALDPDEPTSVRRTAVLAFSERPADPLPRAFDRMVSELAAAVRSVRTHRQLLRRGPRRVHGEGVRIAHIHLGETGGLATLLPQLGDALAGQQRVAEPMTILRNGVVAEANASGHRIERVDLEANEGGSFTDRWPSSVAAARGIRGALLAGRLPDVVHLRMADPGSYSGAKVALSMGVPLVFTLAPDPHGPIEAAEQAGTLDRRSFASKDGRAALWFRASLVERLAREARELVLFPRDGLPERIEQLTGIDLTSGPPRHTIVAEGVDLERTDLAAATVASNHPTAPVLDDLRRAIAGLPESRHGLPLVLSAGRLIELKGMARLVEAFAADERLAASANLVIVGGDLADPTAAEAAELARIQRSFQAHPGLQDRVVLLGRRSHADVALLMAATHSGWRSLVGSGGAYACASTKEEFGLAIVEALAAGLPATAPLTGGPATYLDPGRTGHLVDTTDVPALAASVRATLELAQDPETAARSRGAVEDRYTLERMARSLTAIYRITVGASSLAAPVTTIEEDAA